MKPLFTDNEFNSAKSLDLLPCQCYNCNQSFLLKKSRIKDALNPNEKTKAKFCTHKCKKEYQDEKILVQCSNCSVEFKKKISQIKKSKSGKSFCSKSCAATYNNKHKTSGTRISKLELWLQTKLTKLYPDLEFHFNRKDAINSELDIYIPSMKLAFELNGIFHYEPIYGDNKLHQTQYNDNRKFQLCLEQGIELCIIDTSQQKYFKEQSSIMFLNIIKNLIDLNAVPEGVEPSILHE